MIRDLKVTLRQSAPTLAADAAGGAAIFVLLLVALYLPNLI